MFTMDNTINQFVKTKEGTSITVQYFGLVPFVQVFFTMLSVFSLYYSIFCQGNEMGNVCTTPVYYMSKGFLLWDTHLWQCMGRLPHF